MKPVIVLTCLLLGVAALPGCTSLVVGGAAGGYQGTSDTRSATVRSDDATITSTINTKFVHDDLVRAVDIRVDTRDGIVTLNGTVDSPAASLRAVQLARSTSGVKRVNSNLVVRR